MMLFTGYPDPWQSMVPCPCQSLVHHMSFRVVLNSKHRQCVLRIPSLPGSMPSSRSDDTPRLIATPLLQCFRHPFLKLELSLFDSQSLSPQYWFDAASLRFPGSVCILGLLRLNPLSPPCCRFAAWRICSLLLHELITLAL